jgi:NADPH-dependent 2,4-dienoyl-CoA reductase/sulfur reductase-like enzyme
MVDSAAPRVVVIGAGWAGLGAADHLVQQGYQVTLLEAGAYPGGLVAGWQTAAKPGLKPVHALDAIGAIFPSRARGRVADFSRLTPLADAVGHVFLP